MKPVAVISDPRTSSHHLVDQYIKETGNPYGGIHVTRHVASHCLTIDNLEENRYTLHGHWYSLHQIDPAVVEHVNRNYRVIEIERAHTHRFLSAAIVIYTKDKDCRDYGMWLPIDVVDEYFDIMAPSIENRKLIKNLEYIDFDQLHGKGTSYRNYAYNYDRVYNSDELLNRYLTLYERLGPC